MSLYSNSGVRKSSLRPVLVATCCALAVAGCSSLKAKPKARLAYEERPVELLYSTGADRMDRHLWSQAVDYFQEVERQHPYSEWSRRAILMQAFAHYQGNNYDQAIADSDRFLSLYPGNQAAPYAHYLKAICYFEQIVDVGRDQAATGQALDNLREVTQRYPHTEYATDARLKIDMVNDQLAGKEMNVGRWYLRQNDLLAAVGRFKTVVDRYQTTTHTPEALYRLVEADLTLGLIKDATETGAVLGYNYPGDPWYADAYQLLTAKGLRPSLEPIAREKRSVFHATFIKDKTATVMPPTSMGAAMAPKTEAAPPAATAAAEVAKPKKKLFHVPSFHIPFTGDGDKDKAAAPDVMPTPETPKN